MILRCNSIKDTIINFNISILLKTFKDNLDLTLILFILQDFFNVV